MRRSSKKSSSSSAAAGEEQVNEKQNRKRKGVSTNLTSRKAQRVPTKAVSKEIERIDQLFFTYADSSSSMIDPEGIETLCSHLEVPHTDVRILMLAWKMGCEKQGYFTLDEWRTGMKALRADSISKLKKAFPELVQEVTRSSNFHDFYPYAFRYCLTEDKKKCIEIPVACELLNLVLSLQFRPQVEKLINYLKHQNEYKVINMDQWMGFLRFCNEINFPSLDNYDADQAWPLILDNFVEWLRANEN
ncbi:DCN1-like protein 4 isoform X1 [Hordeum vulgare subsp. vulgare]|uniref:Defective in cullin neddylation protein n=1 Tax=Hordeum vulgare subsp. vulgare TaxID=112509 RepID=A0A8I6YA56_HORVV|nr:DCN1-like protein 4 isoform X1 [Hordeum vulgare subsp. vulgare]